MVLVIVLMSCENPSFILHLKIIKGKMILKLTVSFNIFYSSIRYTGKDWLGLKVLHYPLKISLLPLTCC